MFEEKLLEPWRRPACQCVVVQKWINRAQNNIAVAMFAPPAVKEAMKSSRRIRVLEESTVARPGLEDAPPPRIMAVLEDGGSSPIKSRHRKNNYVPVATKKSGGARQGAGRKRSVNDNYPIAVKKRGGTRLGAGRHKKQRTEDADAPPRVRGA